MSIGDDIRAFLPQFLSGESMEELFSCLDNFPENIDSRMYCDRTRAESFFAQGDGVKSLKLVDWNTETLKEARVILLSNTCDISPDNPRNNTPYCVYCILFELDKYLNLLRKSGKSEQHIDNVRKEITKQRSTTLFYLPKGQGLEKEYVALLDHVGSCPYDYLSSSKTKLFSLSNYGFYMFLLKLSIHFTRIRDGIDRSDKIMIPSSVN